MRGWNWKNVSYLRSSSAGVPKLFWLAATFTYWATNYGFFLGPQFYTLYRMVGFFGKDSAAPLTGLCDSPWATAHCLVHDLEIETTFQPGTSKLTLLAMSLQQLCVER